MVLPYLKPEHVEIGRQQIVASADAVAVINEYPALNRFFQYFDNNWMNRIEAWNVFALQDHATNNDVEGWHYEFNKHLTKANRALTFWHFVEMIGNRVTIDDESYEQLTGGQQLTSRSARSLSKENNITRIKLLYSSGSIALDGTADSCVRAYLRGLKNNY